MACYILILYLPQLFPGFVVVSITLFLWKEISFMITYSILFTLLEGRCINKLEGVYKSWWKKVCLGYVNLPFSSVFNAFCWFFTLNFIKFYRYYYNKITKESKWLIPEELKVSITENNTILNILSYFMPHVSVLTFLFRICVLLQVCPWASWKGKGQCNSSRATTESLYSTLCSFCDWSNA